jgi:hypothetical protein
MQVEFAMRCAQTMFATNSIRPIASPKNWTHTLSVLAAPLPHFLCAQVTNYCDALDRRCHTRLFAMRIGNSPNATKKAWEIPTPVSFIRFFGLRLAVLLHRPRKFLEQ